jgi:NTE family protein
MTEAVAEERSDVAVTLSGGGYRAMLFHLGFLWRLRDADMLRTIDRFASVSGGSIVAGMLGVAWTRGLDLADDGASFRKLVAGPIMKLSTERIDILAGLLGRIPGLNGAITRGTYDNILYSGARMRDMPAHPRFVFCATSLHSGKMVRINHKYIADWTTGTWTIEDLCVSDAVAASSAFPPVLSPVVFGLDERTFEKVKGARYDPPARLSLTDGGVYDNLGIEAVWKTSHTIYVSDAGKAFSYAEKGPFLLSTQAMQVTSIMQDQIGSLRFRQILDAFEPACPEPLRRKGFMVSSDYLVDASPGSPAFDRAHALDLAATGTRLTRLDPARARALVNWGYIATDHRVRAVGLGSGMCALPYPDYPV